MENDIIIKEAFAKMTVPFIKKGRYTMKTEKRKVIQGRTYNMPLITDKTIRDILNYPKFFRGHVRTSTGKIYKTDEFEKRSNRVLGTRMP